MAIQILSPLYKDIINKRSKVFLNAKNHKNDVSQVGKILNSYIRHNAYPGDYNLDSYKWITEAALSINEVYEPNYMLLSYANPYYASVYTSPNDLCWDEHRERLFSELERFIHHTDFIPIIIGTGGTYILEDTIDLSYLEGQVNYNWPGNVYASVYNSTAKDLKLLEKDNAIQMVIPRERLQVMVEETKGLFPDYFLIARRGYAFANSKQNPIYRINARDAYIPIISPRPIKHISEVNSLIRSLLAKQKKVALIILEGMSSADFLWDYQLCSNTFSWFVYPLEFQYLAMGTGFNISKLNVFSMFCANQISFEKYVDMLNLPGRTIGSKPNIRSAAVGSRRGLTHIASGADISLECGY